jgi:hypothetical protein
VLSVHTQTLPLIRAVLPCRLRTLAAVGREIELEVGDPVTLGAVCDAPEARYPGLKGTFRDAATLRRRPFLIRFYAGDGDDAHLPPETLLPEAAVTRKEPFCLVEATAGG